MSAAQPKEFEFSTTQVFWVLALFALLPLMGAQFGSGNQVEQLSLIARLNDPNFALGDHYINNSTGFSPRIYYTHAMAAMTQAMPMPLAMAGLGVVANFLLAMVTYLAARGHLRIGSGPALLAALIVMTNSSISLGLAGFLRFDSIQPANIAIPLALAGLALIAAGRVIIALPCFVFAAMAHPLIGIEIALLGYAGAGLTALGLPRGTDVVRRIIQLGIGGAIFAAAMALLWFAPLAKANPEQIPDAQFFDILINFRAPHHYLALEFYWRSWLEAGLFASAALVAALMAGKTFYREQGAWALGLAALVAIILMGASVWFVDTQQSRLWATLQLFRMVMVVKWVGILMAAALVARHWAKDPALGLTIGATLVIATSGAQAYAMWLVIVGSLAIWAVEFLFKNNQLRQVLIWIGAVGMVAISAGLHLKYGLDLDLARGIVGLVVLALVCLAPLRIPLRLVVASIAVIVTLAASYQERATGLFGIDALRAQFTWADSENDETDIARAAGELSPEGAIWLIPPLHEKFRLLSGRAAVVDFKSIPFNDLAMRDWKMRLDALYGPITERGFAAGRQMTETYRAGIDYGRARDFGATHAVLFAQTPWGGEVLYQNDTFKAVRLDATTANN